MPTIDDLIRYAHLAAAAKADGASLTSKLAVHGATLIASVSDTETDLQGYVAIDQSSAGRRILVAFRGTTDMRDAVTDGEAWLKPYCPWANAEACVHAGGLIAYHRIAAALRGDIVHLADEHTPMVFLGHSLGAIETTLAAAEASAYSIHGPISCVTFGSPRVGDVDFAHHFEAAVPDTTRVVHAFDGVPTVPVELMGYRHVGQLLHLGDDGHQFPQQGLAQRAWAWMRGRQWHDHHINGYIAALHAASLLASSPS